MKNEPYNGGLSYREVLPQMIFLCIPNPEIHQKIIVAPKLWETESRMFGGICAPGYTLSIGKKTAMKIRMVYKRFDDVGFSRNDDFSFFSEILYFLSFKTYTIDYICVCTSMHDIWCLYQPA